MPLQPLFGIDSRSSREYDTAKFEFEKKNGLVQGKWKCVMEERDGNKPMRMDYMIVSGGLHSKSLISEADSD